MKKQEVTVVEINPTKSAEVMNVTVSSPNQSAETTFDVFMQGHSKAIAKAPLKAFQGMTPQAIETLGIAPGVLLEEAIGRECAIQVIETIKPQYEGHNPKTRGEGGAICTSNGLPIYRTTRLVVGAEVAITEDIKLPMDKEVVANPVSKEQMIAESIGK